MVTTRSWSPEMSASGCGPPTVGVPAGDAATGFIRDLRWCRPWCRRCLRTCRRVARGSTTTEERRARIAEAFEADEEEDAGVVINAKVVCLYIGRPYKVDSCSVFMS